MWLFLQWMYKWTAGLTIVGWEVEKLDSYWLWGENLKTQEGNFLHSIMFI